VLFPLGVVVWDPEFGTLEANPNGIASHSPRLPYSATLGRRIEMGPNPERGCACRAPG
jgi:hypothetical protein